MGTNVLHLVHVVISLAVSFVGKQKRIIRKHLSKLAIPHLYLLFWHKEFLEYMQQPCIILVVILTWEYKEPNMWLNLKDFQSATKNIKTKYITAIQKHHV